MGKIANPTFLVQEQTSGLEITLAAGIHDFTSKPTFSFTVSFKKHREERRGRMLDFDNVKNYATLLRGTGPAQVAVSSVHLQYNPAKHLPCRTLRALSQKEEIITGLSQNLARVAL